MLRLRRIVVPRYTAYQRDLGDSPLTAAVHRPTAPDGRWSRTSMAGSLHALSLDRATWCLSRLPAIVARATIARALHAGTRVERLRAARFPARRQRRHLARCPRRAATVRRAGSSSRKTPKAATCSHTRRASIRRFWRDSSGAVKAAAWRSTSEHRSRISVRLRCLCRNHPRRDGQRLAAAAARRLASSARSAIRSAA